MLFQAQQKQRKTQNDVNHTSNDLFQALDGLANDKKLKAKKDNDNRGHIQNGRKQRVAKLKYELSHQNAAHSMPKPMTKIIGVRLAKAIRPNPSIIGLRPRITWARPTPKAVTNGTVIVDVVTPPAS